MRGDIEHPFEHVFFKKMTGCGQDPPDCVGRKVGRFLESPRTPHAMLLLQGREGGQEGAPEIIVMGLSGDQDRGVNKRGRRGRERA